MGSQVGPVGLSLLRRARPVRPTASPGRRMRSWVGLADHSRPRRPRRKRAPGKRQGIPRRDLAPLVAERAGLDGLDGRADFPAARVYCEFVVPVRAPRAGTPPAAIFYRLVRFSRRLR
jgi:hypothetical protein